MRPATPRGCSMGSWSPCSAPTRRRRSVTRLRLPALALLTLTALALHPGAAAAAPSVTDEGVTNRFPGGIEFSVSASADQPIEKVSLRYTVLPDGTRASAVPEIG